MKTKTLLCSLLAVGLLMTGVTPSTRAADKAQSKLEGKAKVTKAQAQKTIHRLWRDGKITAAELEEEEDGKLIWSFDIATPGTKDIIEAHVDARTGKVVSVDVETPADEAKASKAEVNEIKGKKQLKKGDEDAKEIKKESKEKKKIKQSEKEEEEEKDAKEKKSEKKGKKDKIEKRE